jgi:chromosome segregation ATPase
MAVEETLKKANEDNPLIKLTKEVEEDIGDLKAEIAEAESEIDRLNAELVQAKLESLPYPTEVMAWNKNYIEEYYPMRVREIEAERLSAINELPGFGQPRSKGYNGVSEEDLSN